jgi:hypothetical protein
MMSMDVTETKYEWRFGDYSVQTYVGEYGVHAEWFRGDNDIDSNDVPDIVMDAYEQLCEEEGL